MPAIVAWARRWGISVASLTGGVLTLFVLRRGLPHVAWIVGYVLLLWLLVAGLVQVRDALLASPRRTHRLVLTATEYTVQTLFHGVLLFVLPAYYAATTLTSVNVVFLAALVILALLTSVDPWYRALVGARRWAHHAVFLVSVFAALNLALPLVGVRPGAALVLSAWLAAVSLTPAVCRALGWPWWSGLIATAMAGMVVAGLVGVVRIAVPPAPLFLASARLEWGVASSAPDAPTSPIDALNLRTRGLVAHTAIYAPAGLRQPVAHVWRHGDTVSTVVPLTVEGGRLEGYRTFSRKTQFPADAEGRWTVDVMTAGGQLIGRLRFRVAS